MPSGVPLLACIGALSPEKQVGVAIDAVARLDGVHLLVVGDGPQVTPSRDQARKTAPGRVHLVGSMPGPTEALAAADLVVLTSRTEGMPGVLIEAGLSGRAAVATDVGGVSEIVRDGETGVLVPLDDVGAPGALAARVAHGVRRRWRRTRSSAPPPASGASRSSRSSPSPPAGRPCSRPSPWLRRDAGPRIDIRSPTWLAWWGFSRRRPTDATGGTLNVTLEAGKSEQARTAAC